MKFQVFDNGKPASITGFPSLKGNWPTHIFDTFEAAQAYTKEWLGGEGHDQSVPREPNVGVDYSGYGDVITIFQTVELADEVSYTGTNPAVSIGTLGIVDVISTEDPNLFWVQTDCGGFMGWCSLATWKLTGKKREVSQEWLEMRGYDGHHTVLAEGVSLKSLCK